MVRLQCFVRGLGFHHMVKLQCFVRGLGFHKFHNSYSLPYRSKIPVPRIADIVESLHNVGDNSKVAALFFSDPSYYFGYRALGSTYKAFQLS